MELTTLFTFVVAILVLTMTPGVDTLLIIRNTSRGGTRDGLITSLGTCGGLLVHALLSALGIAFILEQTAWAFNLLKLAGAGYLIWLGITSLIAARRGAKLVASSVHDQTANAWQALREGLLTNVLNPKTLIFYMAFLPQFIDPTGNPVTQSLLLAGIHCLVATLWQGTVVLLVARARDWMLRPRVSQVFNAVTGTVLLGLGGRLAASDL